MKKILILTYSKDRFGKCYCQSLKDSSKTLVSCQNLDEYPEDTIIDRDLIDCYDIIDAIEYGMNLKDKGYTTLEIHYVEEKMINYELGN